jgi:hypothetical protein
LQDRDTLALGTTSKKMQLVAKNELADRDKKLEELFSRYTITRKFNIQGLKEANLFCMAEIHRNPQCASDQLTLIAFLASRGPVLVITEGWPSMKSGDTNIFLNLLAQNQIKSSLDPVFMDNIFVIGWDNQDDFKRLQVEIYRKYEQLDIRLEVDRNNVVRRAHEVLPKKMLPSNEQLDELKKLNLSRSDMFSLYMSKIMGYGLNNILQQSPEKLSQRQIDLVTQYVKVETISITYKTQRGRQVNAAIIQTFPIRTKSMISTLQKLKRYLLDEGIRNAKCVLCAGLSHLDSETSPDLLDPEMVVTERKARDLTSLYEELNNHRAAILLPSEILSAHDEEDAEKIV